MGSVKYAKDSKEFKFFQEYWKFIQKFAVPENTNEYFDALMDAANELIKKYDNDKFVAEVVTAHVMAQDRKNKERMKVND